MIYCIAEIFTIAIAELATKRTTSEYISEPFMQPVNPSPHTLLDPPQYCHSLDPTPNTLLDLPEPFQPLNPIQKTLLASPRALLDPPEPFQPLHLTQNTLLDPPELLQPLNPTPSTLLESPKTFKPPDSIYPLLKPTATAKPKQRNLPSLDCQLNANMPPDNVSV